VIFNFIIIAIQVLGYAIQTVKTKFVSCSLTLVHYQVGSLHLPTLDGPAINKIYN